MNSNVTIVIPVYNEELNIGSVVENIINYADSLIVVDDKSTDKTLEILNQLQSKYKNKIILLKNNKNKGIGYTVKKGFSKALELENEIVIKFDGDNQHLVEDIPKFLEKITKENYDFVKGNRFINSEYSQPMPNLKIVGNLITTSLQKIVSGNYNISDPNNGFLAIKKQVLSLIDFGKLKNNYYFENSLLIYVSSLGMKIGEVPIKTIYGKEKSSIPIFIASIKLIPTFLMFFYLRNILNARFNLSINSIIFFLFATIAFLNIFFNNIILWIICLVLFLSYISIDILNFINKK